MILTNRYRVIVLVNNEREWYKLMAECRTWFGQNWQGQSHVRKKFRKFISEPLEIWFDVPDPNWSTWIAVKLGTRVKSVLETNK